jgi:integrase/recombinase XerD
MPRKLPELVGDANDPQGMVVLLRRFLEALQVKNYSADTVSDRHVLAAYFIRWAHDRGITRPSEVTRPILERYQRFLFHYRKRNGDPLTFGSQRHFLVVVRVWFRWLAKNNHILYNPASDLELPRLEYRLPKHVLSAREAELIINQPNVEQPLGLRDRAILETLYSTAIRRKELVGLHVYDLDTERETLMVRQGKGKKDRMVPIGTRAVRWVQRYIEEVRPGLLVGNAAGAVLFLDERGGAFAPDRLTERVASYVAAADIGKKGSCHLFRHAAATLMLENGADVRFVQALLGHANLDTTAIYTQVAIRALKAVHTATHPASTPRGRRRAQGKAAAGVALNVPVE